jgi:hypothetical protein
MLHVKGNNLGNEIGKIGRGEIIWKNDGNIRNRLIKSENLWNMHVSMIRDTRDTVLPFFAELSGKMTNVPEWEQVGEYKEPVDSKKSS